MQRTLEPEAMDTFDAATAYDQIVRIYNYWLIRPQVKSALRVMERKKNLILDIGCGTARIPIGIAKNNAGCKIYAVDMSLNMLK